MMDEFYEEEQNDQPECYFCNRKIKGDDYLDIPISMVGRINVCKECQEAFRRWAE